MSSARMSRASAKQSATSSLRHQRRELVRPLVEVHVGVQAARLLQLVLRLPGRLQHVERARRRGEEAERVEVAAPHAALLDDPGGRRGRQAQRPGRRAAPRRGAAGRPSPTRACRNSPGAAARRRCGQQVADPRRASRRAGRVPPSVSSVTPAGRGAVVAAQLLDGRAGQDDAGARMPAAQLRGPVRVVGEQEVLDRVLGAGAAARQVRRDPAVDALLVRRAGGHATSPRRDDGGERGSRRERPRTPPRLASCPARSGPCRSPPSRCP